MPATERCEHFTRLFTFDQWATARFVGALESLPGAPPPRVIERLAHCIWASRLWFCRVQGEPAPGEGEYKGRDLSWLRERAVENDAAWLGLVRDAPDEALDRPITYTNTRGVTYTSALADILTHIVNHATYHRGQIASDLKSLVGAPIVSDFIAWARGD